MALAWIREGLGGLLSLLSLAAFTLVELNVAHHRPGPAFAVIAVPGALFLVSWGLHVRLHPAGGMESGGPGRIGAGSLT